jgi:hypothetical protein
LRRLTILYYADRNPGVLIHNRNAPPDRTISSVVRACRNFCSARAGGHGCPGARLLQASAFATIFGSVRGVVHDPQHRPIQGAQVTLKAQTRTGPSPWTPTLTENLNSRSVPIGNYTVTVSSKGFQQTQQDVIVQSDTSPVLHFQLAIAGAKGKRRRLGNSSGADHGQCHADNHAEPQDIQQTPGADRTNGMEMITDYVPATYVTHDMLHMNGGHQVEWLIDGVPSPTPTSPATWGRRSIPRTSTISKFCKAATTPPMATAPTECSTLRREPV